MLDHRVPASAARAGATRTTSPNLRAWCAVAALGVATFAVYISLVPFNFRIPDGGISRGLLFEALETRYHARGNLIANTIMFLPLGFFGAGALVPAAAGWSRRIVTGSMLLLSSVALSFAIEMLQVFVPGRTPSLPDVIAQTIGTAFGFAIWFPLAAEVRYWAGRIASGTSDALRMLLTAYAGVRALILLEPFDVTVDPGLLARRWNSGRIVIDPLDSGALSWDLIPSVLSDFVLAVPIGALAVVGGTVAGTRRTAGPALVLGTLFFAIGELCQVFIRSRTADSFDLLVNLAGMAAGVALALVLLADHAQRPVTAHRLVPVGGLLLCVGLYVAYNWSPYDFRFDPGFVERRLGQLLAVPFHGYYQNPEFKALRDLLLKMAMTLPMGVFLYRSAGFAGGRDGHLLTALALLVAGLFFGGVEAGQALLPSRYPDNTDVLLGVAGVWIGIRLSRPFARRDRA